MPYPKNHIPKLRRHKVWKRGVVTLSGHDHYLGPWPQDRPVPPDDVKAAYDEIIARWLAHGRRPLHAPAAVGDPAAPPPLTVAGLILAYWPHAELHYRDADGN